MYKVFEENKENIIKLTFPDKAMLPWTSTKNLNSQYPTDYVEPYCFSHWPGSNYYHYCNYYYFDYYHHQGRTAL